MRIAMYGMPCAGKTTLMGKIQNARVLNGSQELQRISNGRFHDMSEEEKEKIRIEYADYLISLKDSLIISDGHFSFMENVVFTDADAKVYDAFFYLYCSPETLKTRFLMSDKNEKYSKYSVELIRQWQDYEINSLRDECHKRNKEFYVISDADKSDCQINEFIKYIQSRKSTYEYAEELCQRIIKRFTNENEIILVDGDKTFVNEDSFRVCSDGKTSVFDGNFYSLYQSFLFEKDLLTKDIDESALTKLTRNHVVEEAVTGKSYLIISSGIEKLWNQIAVMYSVPMVIANPMICAETKYYLAKLLREQGYTIIAYGDSKIDLYMLREADKGYLFIGKKISRSLKNETISGINLFYDHHLVNLSEEEQIGDWIAICKSDSGVNGSRLALAHNELGMKIGKRIGQVLPEKGTAVLVLERGGRFFGDGVYLGFGGRFYAFNPKKDPFPNIQEERVIIVDSVINTGKSILNTIEKIKEVNPNVEIVIAANVIQTKAVELLRPHLVFTVRVSANSYVGKNQSKQIGNTGPDTADRLFNQIVERF